MSSKYSAAQAADVLDAILGDLGLKRCMLRSPTVRTWVDGEKVLHGGIINLAFSAPVSLAPEEITTAEGVMSLVKGRAVDALKELKRQIEREIEKLES